MVAQRDQATSAGRDAAANARALREAEAAGQSRDARLARALDEVEKLKLALHEAQSAARDAARPTAPDTSQLRALERQRAELLAIVRKQWKLILVLKKQRAHAEAARALAFTEEEFAHALEELQ